MRALYSALCLSLLIPLTGCQDDPTVQTEPEPVRGLKALRIEAQEDASVRHYPSVLQPSDTTQLSFEISGRLNKIEFNVGQQVSAGEALMAAGQPLSFFGMLGIISLAGIIINNAIVLIATNTLLMHRYTIIPSGKFLLALERLRTGDPKI